MLLGSKGHAAIDDQPLPPAFVAKAVDREVHPDLTDAADQMERAIVSLRDSKLADAYTPPQTEALAALEAAKKIVDAVQANPTLWADTAIFITFDEGGGYYDSGFVQPLDFFGDGTRIPMIVVSPFTKAGTIAHNYSDHVSVLKFIERNWSLKPVTFRSRDNYPNPIVQTSNPYVPVNGPAISDLFELFSFPSTN